MKKTTTDIQCLGYAVKTDVYSSDDTGPVVLSLIGRTSKRKKKHYQEFFPRIAKELDITTVIFDYSGHGDSPFDIEDIYPAQNFLEVVTVFDWIKQRYPNRKVVVIGSSYGCYMAAQLVKYRQFDALLLRAPAIYTPEYFYIKKKDEDRDATMTFRQNAEALAGHPLLTCASRFTGKTLVMVHEHDEHIPRQTTDAYRKAFNAEEILIKDITHSLDDATEAQTKQYYQVIYDWLKSLQ